MSEEQEEHYLDKIRLGSIFIEKDMKVVNHYYTLIDHFRQGYITPDDSRLINYPNYNWAWQNIVEFYQMLKNGGYTAKVGNEEVKKMEAIIKRYRELDKDLTFSDLNTAFDFVESVISNTKFYDIVRKSERHFGLDKIKEKYKLND